MDSFLRWNTADIAEYIIIDDSGRSRIHDELKKRYPDYTLLLNPVNIGLIASLDRAYAQVKTPYIFHCQDDWEFYEGGFIEPSLKILESNHNILQVWLWEKNGHPIVPAPHGRWN